MLVYLYNHDINEIKEDLPFLKMEHEADYTGTNLIYGGYKATPITMMHYCEHCNSTIVGHWEYVNKYLRIAEVWSESFRKDFDGKILDDDLHNELRRKIARDSNKWSKYYPYGGTEVKVNVTYISTKKKNDIDDFCWDLIHNDIGEVIRFEFNEKRKKKIEPLLTISPKIIQYRKEIETFFSMTKCPICGKAFKKEPNRHVYFCGDSSATKDLYKNLCKVFPKHLFESHEEYEEFNPNEVPQEYHNFNDETTFIHMGRLASSSKFMNYKNKVHIYYFDLSSLDTMIAYFNHFTQSQINESANLKINNTVDEFNVKPMNKVFNKNSFDTDNLKNYLNYICQLESNVFSVTERLKELYLVHEESEKDASASHLILAMNIRNKLNKTKEDYAKAENIKPETFVSIEDFAFDYPDKPVEPEMPEQPTLKTPGLFNKKKIEAANNLLTQEYQAKLTAYNAEMELYSEELRKYNRKVEELEQKQNEMYSAKLAKKERNRQVRLDKLKERIQDLENTINEIENNASDIVTQEKIKNELIETEIKEAEKTLSETYKALNELYSYDVIFSKYRNFVAVSTFYEYLSSGRCTTLEGADGAYNIYESEIRANMMISQLSQVITSLDKIQQNQFVIYSAIQESNRNLAKLNNSMNSAVSALNSIDITTKNMNSTMEKIAEHTAISAYNSSVTAFYSKKNAELTNALGYMIALS